MGRKQKSVRGLSRREILKYGLYGGLMAGLAPSLWLSGCRKQPRGRRPNIILIVVDTLRADHVGCYGYQRDTTPNIDRLAREGILFRNAISAAPWTLPSIATLVTSQYPCVLGIRNKVAAMSDRFPLLSEVLKQYNYATHGIVSHILVSQRLGFGRGFDEYDEGSALGPTGVSSPAVTHKAVSFLQKSYGRPFFLFAHYFDPHYHYILHPKYNYYPSYKGGLRNGESILSLWKKRNDMSANDIKYLLALYDSEIAFTDEKIGMLLDELKCLGLYDNTMVILTSDHGEEFMERGWIGHSITLYQELIQVPLIIKLPGARPYVVESCVGLIDIMPTVLDYLGLDLPDGLEGKPLNLARPRSITARPVFSETFNPQTNQPGHVEPIAFRSVTMSSSKLVYDEKKVSRQIYDLSEDPYERNDLSGQHSEQNKRLEALLLKWVKYVKTKRKRSPVQQDESELFTPEQRRQLESLGYL